MTISNTIRTAGPYIGNGVTTAFPFYFKIFKAADLLAVQTDVATGVATSLVLNSGYTVTLNADQNASPGGTAILPAALATGKTLVLTSALDYLQPLDITNGGGFYPSVLNAALDRLTIFCQQLFSLASRSLKLPLSDTGLNTELPSAAARANKVLAFNDVGLPIVVSPISGSSLDLAIALASTNGSSLVGNGGETVGQSLDALQMSNYATLRASTTPRKSVYITGIYGATFAGIAGLFLRDDSDTTSIDNGGTIIVRTDGVRYKRAGVTRMNIQWFGAVPSQSVNNSPMIQAACDAAKLIGVGIYIPSVTAIGYRFDQGILLDSFFVGITGDSMAFSTLNYTGTGTALSFKTTSGQLGVYSNFQIQSGLSTDTLAARRAVSRGGIFWKCYGGQGHISNVKVLGFNGFGSRFEAIWDSRIDGLLVESCGGGGNYALGVGNGTDTSNHCVFTRLQVENSVGNAVYIEGLNMVVIGLHSERTVGDGSYSHVFLGDLTLIDGRIEQTSGIKVRVGIATGSMQNYKIFGGPTYFDWGSRIVNPARIIDCELADVIIPSSNLRQYDFSGGSMISMALAYTEKQTTLTGVTVTGGITLTGSGVRLNIYDGTVVGNIISSGGGVNTVEVHDSDLAYYPTVQIALVYNSTIDNSHSTPGGQKARSYDCIFKAEVVIQNNGTKWETQGCEYGNGITLGAGTPGWKFGKGDWVSSGAVSAGLLAAPTSSSAAFANGEYTARIIKAVGQPKGWYCTTAGVAPTLAFTSEGNL